MWTDLRRTKALKGFMNTISSTTVATAEIENAGDITLDAINAAANSTIAIGNSAGTYVTNLVVDGNIKAGGYLSDGGVVAASTSISTARSAAYEIETAAAETNTMGVPQFCGQIITLYCRTYAVGDRVVTMLDAAATGKQAINQTGNNTLTFGAVGDFIGLISIDVNGTLYWRVLINDGVALSTVA